MADLTKNERGEIVPEQEQKPEQAQPVVEKVEEKDDIVRLTRSNADVVIVKLIENQRNISLQMLNELKAIKELLKVRK
jgi:hypothetical protein